MGVRMRKTERQTVGARLRDWQGLELVHDG